MLSACVKAVQTVGKVCWNSVVVHPHIGTQPRAGYSGRAENPLFMPDLSRIFTQNDPQVKSALSHLLRPWFSTLSTQPITTTTNLKRKER